MSKDYVPEDVSKPFEVTDVDIAFPTVAEIPFLNKIPKEIMRGNTKWNQAFSDWFYDGISLDQLKEREGIDKTKAIRAIKSMMGSYGLKHEHKEAAVAYCLSLWFDDYTRKNKP